MRRRFLPPVTSTWVISMACVFFTACESGSSQHQTQSAADPALNTANPAAVYCLEQGYQLQEAQIDAISKSTLCVDNKGHKCPVWQFYRGECRLE